MCSHRNLHPKKKDFAKSRGSDTDTDANVSTLVQKAPSDSLGLLLLLHPWRCIGGTGIA